MDLPTIEVLAHDRQRQLYAEATHRRQLRAAHGPEVHTRKLGKVIEMRSSNPAATSRLLISGGAVVVEHDEVGETVRTVFANRSRTHFWVVVGA